MNGILPMASVNLEFSAYLDPRFKVLGKLSGLSKFDAIGRMGIIWVHCVEKCQNVLSPLVVDLLAELDGYSSWVVEAELGERLQDGEIRIRGTEGRIEYLAQARVRQKIASQAAKKKRETDISPKLDPKLDRVFTPISDPSLESSSTSTSSFASSSKRKKSLVDPSDTTLLWNFYSEKLKTKSIEAVHGGAKTNKLLKGLITVHGLEKAKRLIDTFLSDFEPFVSEQAWSIGLLVSQQQKYLNRLDKPPISHVALTFGGD